MYQKFPFGKKITHWGGINSPDPLSPIPYASALFTVVICLGNIACDTISWVVNQSLMCRFGNGWLRQGRAATFQRFDFRSQVVLVRLLCSAYCRVYFSSPLTAVNSKIVGGNLARNLCSGSLSTFSNLKRHSLTRFSWVAKKVCRG